MSDVTTKLAKEANDKAVEIARLKAENDRLREQGARLFDKTLELGTENAKLREERDHWHVEQVHAYGNWEDAYKRATELETDNAKLRDELDAAKHDLSLFSERIVELGAENSKLRELVKKLVILAFARCADCDLFEASCALVPTQKCLLWNECESIARELGVEVDDGS